jgi:hypothetical protein
LENTTSFLKVYVSNTESESFPSDVITAVLVISKEHTKLFKESNVNITKAILELFFTVLRIHKAWKKRIEKAFCSDAICLGIEKLGDKKFSEASFSLLYCLCEVCPPESILIDAISAIGGTKAPLPHELLLQWCTGFFQSFGVKASGNSIPTVASWIIKVNLLFLFLFFFLTT